MRRMRFSSLAHMVRAMSSLTGWPSKMGANTQLLPLQPGGETMVKPFGPSPEAQHI